MEKQEQPLNGRQTYMDCLKILATFAVMIGHTAAQYSGSVTGMTWDIFYFYDAIIRWSVPVFVMVSGSLFLSGNRSIERIYKKNILRMATAFIFWSMVYALVSFFTSTGYELKNMLRWFVEGPTHMWFLFMIVGLYMIVPFLQKITVDRKLTAYFLLLSLFFTFLLPYCIMVISFKSEKISSIGSSVLNKFSLYFTFGYVAYFVCGYFLNESKIRGKLEWIIYFFGICGFLVTIFYASVFSVPKKENVVLFHDSFAVNVLLESIAVFVFAKNHLTFLQTGERLKKLLKKLSTYSFGAYLVHAMVITQLNHLLGLNTLSFHPVISVPLIGVITFIISFTISGILHKIPILNKYIV